MSPRPSRSSTATTTRCCGSGARRCRRRPSSSGARRATSICRGPARAASPAVSSPASCRPTAPTPTCRARWRLRAAVPGHARRERARSVRWRWPPGWSGWRASRRGRRRLPHRADLRGGPDDGRARRRPALRGCRGDRPRPRRAGGLLRGGPALARAGLEPAQRLRPRRAVPLPEPARHRPRPDRRRQGAGARLQPAAASCSTVATSTSGVLGRGGAADAPLVATHSNVHALCAVLAQPDRQAARRDPRDRRHGRAELRRGLPARGRRQRRRHAGSRRWCAHSTIWSSASGSTAWRWAPTSTAARAGQHRRRGRPAGAVRRAARRTATTSRPCASSPTRTGCGCWSGPGAGSPTGQPASRPPRSPPARPPAAGPPTGTSSPPGTRDQRRDDAAGIAGVHRAVLSCAADMTARPAPVKRRGDVGGAGMPSRARLRSRINRRGARRNAMREHAAALGARGSLARRSATPVAHAADRRHRARRPGLDRDHRPGLATLVVANFIGWLLIVSRRRVLPRLPGPRRLARRRAVLTGLVSLSLASGCSCPLVGVGR